APTAREAEFFRRPGGPGKLGNPANGRAQDGEGTRLFHPPPGALNTRAHQAGKKNSGDTLGEAALTGRHPITAEGVPRITTYSGRLLSIIAKAWRSMKSPIVSMPRKVRIVLRTAASTNTAKFRPAATCSMTLLIGMPRISWVRS